VCAQPVPPPQVVTVVGIGYAGLPLAVRAAAIGHRVWGLDIDQARVAAVNAGVSPVETVPSGELGAVRDLMTATSDPRCVADSATVVICVPSPLDTAGRPDFGPLTRAVRTVREHLRAGQLVIVESTTSPGTTEGLVRRTLEESSLRAGRDFALAYSPERVDPGNTRFGLVNTPKVVGGFTAACGHRAAEFYRPMVGGVYLTRGLREAEAAKILENTFRQVNIGLVNEFAQICDRLRIDVWDTLAAAATKPFGYMPFYPGPGVGGHCIPEDPMYIVHLVSELGGRFRLAEVAQQINAGMPSWFAHRICKQLGDRLGSHIGACVLLLGVTYKPDIADIRNSPAIELARELESQGVRVSFHDPHIDELVVGGVPLRRVPDLADAIRRSSLTVLLNRHREYTDDLLATVERLFDTTGRSAASAHAERGGERGELGLGGRGDA
jgi:UDP-N-acetyl-D-glucosamine dehydrogenase